MKQFLTTYTQDFTEKEWKPVRYPKHDDRKKPTHTVKYFEYLILDKDKPLEPPEEYYKDYYEKKVKYPVNKITRCNKVCFSLRNNTPNQISDTSANR